MCVITLFAQHFNPRSHERSDITKLDSRLDNVISIHAPTRGATFILLFSFCWSCIFQSTLPREERPSLSQVVCCAYKFQSTLPREERQVNRYFLNLNNLFQSTLPREERQQYCTKNLFIFIQYRQ